jgi:hypothetical protein
MIVLVNLFLAVWLWGLAKLAFDQERNTMAWVCIAWSAANFASAAAEVF